MIRHHELILYIVWRIIPKENMIIGIFMRNIRKDHFWCLWCRIIFFDGRRTKPIEFYTIGNVSYFIKREQERSINAYSQFPMNIIYILRSKFMNFCCPINLDDDENTFLISSNTKTQDSIDVLEPLILPDAPSFNRTDSMFYISQFLSLIQEEPPFPTEESLKDASAVNNGARKGIFSRSQKVDIFNKQKKIKKLENSPFHNYQKHLNNALKKMIFVPTPQENAEIYKKAAYQLWIKYLSTEIKTKKILHSVFNERNEHQSSESELKNYGFWELYIHYGEKTFNMAKNYLSRLAIDQIDETNIDGYLMTRKLKKRDGFKQYILEFKQQLCNGFLRRRINTEQFQN